MKFIARASVFIAALSLSITSFVATASTIPLKSTHNTASVYVLNTVFKNNSATIKTKYYARLDDIAAFLRTRPHMKAVIKGQPSYNHKLGQKRAKTIVTYLTDREVKRRNITTTGFNYSIHKAKPTTTKNKIPLQVADSTASVHIPVGMYKYNSAAIKPKYDARLSDIAAYLRTRPDMQAMIYGYPASHRLAEKRAKNIVQYFVNRNVKSNNISTTGFGIKKTSTYTKPQPVQENTFNSLHTPSGPVLETPVPAKSIPASATTYSSDNTSGYVIPHVYLSGAAGSSVLGEGKVLQPVFLKNDRNLFIYNDDRLSYGAADWENNPWSASLGMGYRQVVNNMAVLGGYVLGSYNKTPTDHSIWTINPGIEALGRVWEFRANGYIPVSKKDWKTEGWADEFGNYNYISYSGHNQYDAWFTYHEEAGIGGDAEIGRTLFKVKNVLVKGYVNSYVFGMKHNDSLYGGGARVTVQPNTYLKFSVNGSYDNYAHTTVMLGAEVSLYDLFAGGSKTLDDQNLERHLFDPIENNSATLSSGSTIPTVGGPEDHRNSPIIDLYNPNTPPGPGPDNGHNTPERTNVWFFNGSQTKLTANELGDVANGTYENPYTGSEFNQDNLAKIYQDTIRSGAYSNAYLYFNPGTYYAYNTEIYGANYTHLELYEHESLWGRMGDEKGFQEPATGNNRPVFVGGFKLDSNTSMNNIILHDYAATGFDTGVIMNSATNVGINDSQIGVDAAGDSGYHTGVAMKDNSSLTINNSQIYGYNADAAGNGVGIKLTNGGDINAINHSDIKGTGAYDGMGIEVAANTSGNAIIDNISGDTTAQFVGKSINNDHNTYGLYAAGQNVQIGSISGSNFIGDGGQNAYGLYANSTAATGNATTTIGSISDSTFDATSNKNIFSKDADAAGLYANSTATTGNATTTIDTISNSTFDAVTTKTSQNLNGNAYGLYANSTADAGSATTTIDSISNSEFKGATSQWDTFGYGLYAGSVTTAGEATTFIGDISQSTFTGFTSATAGGVGFSAKSQSETSGDANTTIGSISDSTFTGDGNVGTGFVAGSYTQNSGNANTDIGSISNSKFVGKGGPNGYGFYAYSTSGSTNSQSQSNTTIGSIINSTFEGSGYFGGFGFTAYSYADSGLAKTTIDFISKSTFTGTGEYKANDGSYGFDAKSQSTNANSETNIGSVLDSIFTGKTDTGGNAYGFIAESFGATTGTVTIAEMTRNTFKASNNSGGSVYGVYLSGSSKDSINVAGNTDPNKIVTYLESAAAGNTFNISNGGRKICVNLPGQTVCD